MWLTLVNGIFNQESSPTYRCYRLVDRVSKLCKDKLFLYLFLSALPCTSGAVTMCYCYACGSLSLVCPRISCICLVR